MRYESGGPAGMCERHQSSHNRSHGAIEITAIPVTEETVICDTS